jgi:C4-type Zn-finger protein
MSPVRLYCSQKTDSRRQGGGLQGENDMKIKKILSQSRRDFWADYECEHCGHIEHDKSGYDDAHFHNEVIPEMKCEKCGMKSDKDYRPLQTKYPASYII